MDFSLSDEQQEVQNLARKILEAYFAKQASPPEVAVAQQG